MSMNREQELQHRNDELLIKLSQCKSIIEQQAAKIAKLEERIVELLDLVEVVERYNKPLPSCGCTKFEQQHCRADASPFAENSGCVKLMLSNQKER